MHIFSIRAILVRLARLSIAPSVLLVSLSAAAQSPTSRPQQSWVPEKAVEIVVATAPASGVDRPARVIQKIIMDQRLVPVSVVVVNKPGGGGAIAQTYLTQRAGDAHYISISSPGLVTAYLTGRSSVSYEDLSVIAILASEYIAFAVRADSPIQTAGDLAERLRRDPSSLSIGIGTAIGNNNHATVSLFAKAIGVDIPKLKTVVFRSPGEVTTAVLGGHVDMMAAAASNLIGLLDNRDIRVFAVAAPSRLGGALSDVPTLREQGYDVVGQQWRAVIGPKGLNKGQTAYWGEVLKAVVATAEWKKYLSSVANDDTFRIGTEALDFVRNEHEKMKAVLSSLGLVKSRPGRQ